LNGASGGTEKKKNSDGVIQQQTRDSLATTAPRASARRGPQEVQVERDPETGRILRVIRQDPEEDDNPLNDPLNDLMDEEEDEPTQKHTTAVVAQLEAQAAHEAELESKKRPRQQSQREEEWIGRLVEKHQDDIQAMVRDKKLNPMQQTAGDIARRIKKWKSKQGETT
jgi:nucleolar protein 16